MYLVRVRNFGVVLLQSQSQPPPFHLLFLPLTEVCQNASLLVLMAVSPLGHIHTNWKKPPPLKGEPQKLFLSDTFVAAQTFSVVTRLALQWCEESHTQPSVCVVRLCRKAVSTKDMQTSTASAWAALKHHSFWLLREYHFISCLTMPIIGSSEG